MERMRCIGILMLLLLGAAKHEDTFTRHLRKANEYVLAHTHYHTRRLPKVVWLSRRQMDKQVNDNEKICPDGDNNPDDVTVAQENGGVVYLTKGEFKVGRDDQTLVHELVHFQQDTNPNESHSLGFLEKEAYRIETQYVKDTHTGELPDPEIVTAESQQKCTV